MSAEQVAPTVARCHGSYTGAESHSARARAADGATAADDGGDPTLRYSNSSLRDVRSRLNSHKVHPNRWDRVAVTAIAVEHENIR